MFCECQCFNPKVQHTASHCPSSTSACTACVARQAPDWLFAIPACLHACRTQVLRQPGPPLTLPPLACNCADPHAAACLRCARLVSAVHCSTAVLAPGGGCSCACKAGCQHAQQLCFGHTPGYFKPAPPQPCSRMAKGSQPGLVLLAARLMPGDAHPASRLVACYRRRCFYTLHAVLHFTMGRPSGVRDCCKTRLVD
jgi:hypothetical protein